MCEPPMGYTLNLLHSHHSVLYLRGSKPISACLLLIIRTIELYQFNSFQSLSDHQPVKLRRKRKKQEDSYLLKITLSELKDNKLVKEGCKIYLIFYITTQLCKTDWKQLKVCGTILMGEGIASLDSIDVTENISDEINGESCSNELGYLSDERFIKLCLKKLFWGLTKASYKMYFKCNYNWWYIHQLFIKDICRNSEV